MSNFSDFIGSTGGGGTTYTPSTAVTAAPVSAGVSYKLDATGKVRPDAESHPESTATADVAGSSLALSTYGTITQSATGITSIGDFVLPNGYFLLPLGSNTANQNKSYLIISQDGVNPLSTSADHYVKTMGNYLLANPTTKLIYNGEDATNWYVFVVTHANERQGMGMLYINKTTYKLTLTSSQQETVKYRVDNKDNTMAFTCRNNTAWLYTRLNSYNLQYIDTGTIYTSVPTNPRYVNTRVTSTAKWLSHYIYTSDLFKIDDAAGTFIFFANNAANSSLFKAYLITVAANGSSVVTEPITASNLGLDSSFNATNTKFFQKSNGDFIAVLAGAVVSNTVEHQTFSYTGGTALSNISTKQSFPAQTAPTLTSFAGQAFTNNLYYAFDASANTLNYFYTSDADKGVAFNFTTNTSSVFSGISELTTVTPVDRRIRYTPTGSMFAADYRHLTKTVFYPYAFDNSIVYTQGYNAIPLADAAEGATVNIVLKDGITSESTLPSSNYLSKQDMYFPFAVPSASSAVTSAIKSIQRGSSHVATGNITISSVDMNKSTVSYLGGADFYITLSSSSTLYVNTSGSDTVSWEVIEYV